MPEVEAQSSEGLHVRVFGPLEVSQDGQLIPLSSPSLRALLAALVLDCNRPVPVDELSARLWGEQLPGRPRAALQTLVSRLRALLGDHGDRIRTHSRGYSIELAPGELDLLRIRRLLSSDDPVDRLEKINQAARLCRGYPLADVHSEVIHTLDVPPLLELRRQVEEARIDAMLAAGRHAEVLVDLRTLTAEYPLHEPLWAQLMLALYRCGRQAEALDAYQAVAGNLVENLGVDPGSQLRELHAGLLRQDADLQVATQPPAARTDWVTSCQLPMAVPSFVGRETLIAQTADSLTDSADGVPIVVLTGEPGIGKSALALQIGHSLRPAFPDGQWFVALDGSREQVREPIGVLGELLIASGVPSSDVPHDLSARSALFRSRTADRRILLILDDAWDEDQVRNLLPGTAGNAVLLTSRKDLSGLSVHQAAICRRLEVLTTGEATRLVERVSGGSAASAVADELSALCGRLPLALRIAAAHLADGGPDAGTELLTDLRINRLDALTLPGDSASALRTVFDSAFRQLTTTQRDAFLLLGNLPGRSVATSMVAAGLDQDVPTAGRTLSSLVRTGVARRAGVGRYAMHDLLAAYAQERAATDRWVDTMLAKALDWQLHSAVNAQSAVYEDRIRKHLTVPLSRQAAKEFTDRGEAIEWFASEWESLTGAVLLTADKQPDIAWRTAGCLWSYVRLRREWEDQAAIYQVALAAARHGKEPIGEAILLLHLANALEIQGKRDQAIEYYQQCLTIAEEIGASDLISMATGNIGMAHTFENRIEEALTYLVRAASMHREHGRMMGLGLALLNLSSALGHAGRLQEALDTAAESADVLRICGERYGEALALGNAGLAHAALGAVDEAVAAFDQAIAVAKADDNTTLQLRLQLDVAEALKAHPHLARPAVTKATQLAAADPAQVPRSLRQRLTKLQD